MHLLLAAVGVFVLGGTSALLLRRSGRMAMLVGRGSAHLACLAAAGGLVSIRCGWSSSAANHAWSVPFGSFTVSLDPLSTWFLLPLLPLAAVAASFGAAYMGAGTRAGVFWFHFDLLVASILLVLIAGNAILFLVSWEVMALSSYFLITWNDEMSEVREAGWVYLVATHVGAAFLLAMFAHLGARAGSLDFDVLASTHTAGAAGGVCFLLAVLGFGTKAGLMPLHVWLPEAHPAAPSHVSALLSGVMITTGIYGLIRSLQFLGAPALWWGWVLLGVGLLSGIGGVAFALAQHDLKRLLAYSSIENMGLVALGLGLGIIGLVAAAPAVSLLGFAGALVHVFNHALFKALLFLAAGSVLHGSGRLDLNRLGGLLRRMPWTGGCMLLGAAAISGLPPLAGFVGEFLLLLAALRATLTPPLVLPGATALAGIALVAGLASAAFTKVFGIGFLGQPRSHEARCAHESPPGLLLPMAVLGGLCAASGFAWTLPLTFVFAAGPRVAAHPFPAGASFGELLGSTFIVPLAGGILLLALGVLGLLRWALYRRRPVRGVVTWDCGYARPGARMQYSGTSYVQPLTDMFQPLLRTRVRFEPPQGVFPGSSRLSTSTPALFRTLVYEPAFDRLRAALQRFKWLQHGRLQLYVLYIVLTFIALLIWNAWSTP